MEIESLKIMDEYRYFSLLMNMVEAVALIALLLAIASLAIYLAALAWFYFEQTWMPVTAAQTARRASRPAEIKIIIN